MIHVLAVITAKPGMRDTILTHFRANVPAVKAEQGCIEYGAAIDAEKRDAFERGGFGTDCPNIFLYRLERIDRGGRCEVIEEATSSLRRRCQLAGHSGQYRQELKRKRPRCSADRQAEARHAFFVLLRLRRLLCLHS